MEELVMKFLMGENSEAIKFLDEFKDVAEDKNVTEDTIEKSFAKINEFRKDLENVDKLPNFSDEEKAKLKEIMNGRFDMIEMRLEDIAKDKFGKYQESDVGEDLVESAGMPNYRGLMGNRDEDGSLKPMPKK